MTPAAIGRTAIGMWAALITTGVARAQPASASDCALRLHSAYHELIIGGRVAEARAELQGIVSEKRARRRTRARAALLLAQIHERLGKQRDALGFIATVKQVASPESRALADEAERLRDHIVSRRPLAEVRGPRPGSERIVGSERLKVAFRRAEALLKAFYRWRVRLFIETLGPDLGRKEQLLAAAVEAYRKVIALAGPRGKAIARFRIAALHHHMAGELWFDRFPELLPERERRLRRKLAGQSEYHLRRALAFYRRVASAKQYQPWQRLAAREAKTLTGVLQGRKPKRPAK